MKRSVQILIGTILSIIVVYQIREWKRRKKLKSDIESTVKEYVDKHVKKTEKWFERSR